MCMYVYVYMCLLGSERRERDTIQWCLIENQGFLFIHVYNNVGTYVCHLYFDPRIFMLARCSTPS